VGEGTPGSEVSGVEDEIENDARGAGQRAGDAEVQEPRRRRGPRAPDDLHPQHEAHGENEERASDGRLADSHRRAGDQKGGAGRRQPEGEKPHPDPLAARPSAAHRGGGHQRSRGEPLESIREARQVPAAQPVRLHDDRVAGEEERQPGSEQRAQNQAWRRP
jgi:hypothetical protein